MSDTNWAQTARDLISAVREVIGGFGSSARMTESETDGRLVLDVVPASGNGVPLTIVIEPGAAVTVGIAGMLQSEHLWNDEALPGEVAELVDDLMRNGLTVQFRRRGDRIGSASAVVQTRQGTWRLSSRELGAGWIGTRKERITFDPYPAVNPRGEAPR